jgi:hypothetical protein
MWESKLHGTSFLSLKDSKGVSSKYIKVEDATKVAEMAWNEALDKVKEVYANEQDIVQECKELKI